MKELTRNLVQTGIIGIALLVGTEAFALCPQSAEASDQTFFNDHGCPAEYIDFHKAAYWTEPVDWNSRGLTDGCNINREYTKYWNAAFLISYGIKFDLGFAGRAFHHSTMDYQALARAVGWHHVYASQVFDVLCDPTLGCGNIVAQFDPDLWLALLKTSCLAYNTSPFANPAARASAVIHETWHGWSDTNNLPGGASGHGSGYRDPFFHHDKTLYAAGELNQEKSGHGTSHSVFQVQYEFLCDVVDMPTTQSTLGVRVAAQSTLNILTRDNFPLASPPGFSCGTTKLLAGNSPSSPPPPPCTEGISCNPEDDHCGSGWCKSNGCCYVLP